MSTTFKRVNCRFFSFFTQLFDEAFAHIIQSLKGIRLIKKSSRNAVTYISFSCFLLISAIITWSFPTVKLSATICFISPRSGYYLLVSLIKCLLP